MNLVGALLTIFLCIIALSRSRIAAALAMLAGTLYITQGQAIFVFGFNLMAIRLIEVAAIVRILFRGEFRLLKNNRVDKYLTIFLTTYLLIYTARAQSFNPNEIGDFVDALLTYYSFRVFLSTTGDIQQFLKAAVFVIIPFTIFLGFEASTGHNLFALMGGVDPTPVLRNGHYRCQGSFRCAITAGTFGATFCPLYVGLLFNRELRAWGTIGLAACFAIVLASHSSGPLMAMAAGACGWACWRLRGRMKLVRRALILGIAGLQLVMRRPVWFIFDAMSGVLGGDGWHRSNLIDQYVRHAREWLVAGMPIINTSGWAATQMPWGGVDVTDYYVSIGIGGGLIPLILFIAFLTISFKELRRALAVLESSRESALPQIALLWGAGATLTAHILNLSSVMYWDQIYTTWYLHLAILASLTITITKAPSDTQHEDSHSEASQLFQSANTTELVLHSA